MTENTINILNEYIEQALSCKTSSELNLLNSSYSEKMAQYPQTSAGERLKINIFTCMTKMIDYKEGLSHLSGQKNSLTESERKESEKVQYILDNNLLTYHFQPIVKVETGEIYSYEALMRAVNVQGITPFHILKYAEINNRLHEVEQYTFFNVLGFLAENEELFGERLVFINSMPNIHIFQDKELKIENLLSEMSDRVVVEMTENAEYNDSDLDRIKKKYERLNIPIAIDDYGTGYSNISNLLRYQPDYVKIDRTLLSGIQNSPNKKHFVREIIDFCHANDIMALAEGVETAEELRTVILLGADLVQGYYIARPSPEVLPKIALELKAEILSYHQESIDGRRLRVYFAERGERVLLSRLNKEGYSCIHVGSDYSDGTVTIAGTPHLETDIHVAVGDNFSGRLALESAHLSHSSEFPCINIGENCRITIVLSGSNRLRNSGIKVPESSQLTLDGKGDLDIELNNSEYYGIGNDLQSAHGDLLFNQDGVLKITAGSNQGVCIGSGLGGVINIGRGKYEINTASSMNVCVGSFSGDTKVNIHGCDFRTIANGTSCVIIGSMEGDSDIYLVYSSINCRTDSQYSVSFGSIRGGRTKIHVDSVSMQAEASADVLTIFGALEGKSDISIERSSIKCVADGANALIFGSANRRNVLTLTDIDLMAEAATELKTFVVANDEDIHLIHGRYRLKLNGSEADKLNLNGSE